MVDRTHRVAIVANGFQADYIYNLVKGLSEFCPVELIGSSMYMSFTFNSNVKLLNLRGEHDEDVTLLKKGSRILKYYLKLISYLCRSGVRVVHIQWLRFYLLDGVMISLLARALGKRVYYTAHDIIPYHQDTRFTRLTFRIVYRSQHIIVVHTEYLRSRLIEGYGVPASRIRCIKHGVYDKMDSPKIDYKVARERLEIREDDFVILFFGIIKKYKGLELILQAFNELRDGTGHVKLIIAGKVSRDYAREYEQIVSGYNLEDTTIIPRHIEENEVELLFKATDISVLPYSQASQSGVLFLSYAYGVPVVVPDLGGFPGDVEIGSTGLVFNPGDKESLLQHLLKAKDIFGDHMVERRQYIKQFAEEHYSWRSSCKMLSALYQGSGGTD
jgi:glycosyltransferase involved in cell wall biosynthesis